MERALISICILCVLIVKAMGWRFNCLAVTFYCSQCWAWTLEIYTVRARTHTCTCASTAQGSNVLLAIKVKTPYKSLLWALVNYYSASSYTPLHSIHFFLRLLSHLHHILCTGSPDGASTVFTLCKGLGLSHCRRCTKRMGKFGMNKIQRRLLAQN